MKPDTQKTTKAVREAPTASESKRADSSAFADGLAHAKAKALPGTWGGEVVSVSPRYTVELTTEGWQIKDNPQDLIKVDTYGTKFKAQCIADAWNKIVDGESAIDARGGRN